MDTDERLTALKRAYADIILNTAKEEEARVMSSEQKDVRYKQELKVAKEEVVGMLLRLKQMMDSKVPLVETGVRVGVFGGDGVDFLLEKMEFF